MEEVLLGCELRFQCGLEGERRCAPLQKLAQGCGVDVACGRSQVVADEVRVTCEWGRGVDGLDEGGKIHEENGAESEGWRDKSMFEGREGVGRTQWGERYGLCVRREPHWDPDEVGVRGAGAGLLAPRREKRGVGAPQGVGLGPENQCRKWHLGHCIRGGLLVSWRIPALET